MILAIDTTKRELIKIGLGKIHLDWQEIKTEDQSSDILPAINKILVQNNLELKDIKVIIVNRGSGSFTGVRAGVAVANSLAWSLDIPVVGYCDDQIKESIANISSKNFSQIVLPYYDK
jgi:tRNA threonylcarbamoyladenosine biosynthesis protein TsaB